MHMMFMDESGDPGYPHQGRWKGWGEGRVETDKSTRLVKPQVRSLELLLERYNLFLRNQTDRSGIVILDPVKEESDDNLRHFQAFLMAKSTNMTPLHIGQCRKPGIDTGSKGVHRTQHVVWGNLHGNCRSSQVERAV